MTIEKSVMGIVPGLQATALLGENIKLVKNPSPKKFLKTATTNFIGIGMIGATAGMINKL